jgi:hypothetical protein
MRGSEQKPRSDERLRGETRLVGREMDTALTDPQLRGCFEMDTQHKVPATRALPCPLPVGPPAPLLFHKMIGLRYGPSRTGASRRVCRSPLAQLEGMVILGTVVFGTVTSPGAPPFPFEDEFEPDVTGFPAPLVR